MENKLKKIFDFLTSYEGFYMEQYENNRQLKWIGIKKLPQGLFSVIVTDDINASMDEEAARRYLDRKMETYFLHIVILSRGQRRFENINCRKIVIDDTNNTLVYADPELSELGNVFIQILNTTKKKEQYKGIGFTISLIAINIIIFLISVIISGNYTGDIKKSLMDVDSITLFNMGAKYNIAINNGEVWRLFTAAFLHGGILHIACNMYCLYGVGAQIEKIYGKLKYLFIYVLSALGSSFLSYLLAPKSLSVGASGAVFGLFGAQLVFAIRHRDKINKGVIINLIAMIGLNLYIGITLPNIDNYGHIGGLITGIIVSIICMLI